MRTVLSVPDISCEHCVSAITRAVDAVTGVTAVTVAIAERRVVIDGTFSDAEVRAAVRDAGYDIADQV